MVHDSFSGRLLPGERIIWSGPPGQGFILTQRDILLIPFSLLWCGFAVFWEASVLNGRGSSGFFIIWGAMFVCIGLYFVAGRFIVDAWVRRGMSYAVTDRRVLIVRSAPFSKFMAVSLAQIPDADINEHSNGRGTIRFGQAASMWVRQNMGIWSPSLDATPQFLMIDDARRVFDIVQASKANSKIFEQRAPPRTAVIAQ